MRITLPVAWSGGTLLFGNGSAAAPSIAFASDTNTGLFRVAEDTVGLSLGGVSQYQFATTGFTLIGTNSQAGGYLSVTGTNGGLSLTALGTNQNITLTPSGTGMVSIISSGTGFSSFPAGKAIIIGYDSSKAYISAYTSGAASPLMIDGQSVQFAVGGTEAGRFAQTSRSLLLGTTTDSSNGRIQLATHTTSAGGIGFGTDTALFRFADGKLALTGTTPMFLLGGTTSSFPALKRSSSVLECRLADDSGVAGFTAGAIRAGSAATDIGAGANQIVYGGTTATTVGASGAASALPANPLGYIIVNVAGTTAKIPYYNN